MGDMGITAGQLAMLVCMASGALFLGVGIVVTRLALRRRDRAEDAVEAEVEVEVEEDSGDPLVGSRGAPGGRQESTAEDRGDGGDRADRGMPAGTLEEDRAVGVGRDGGVGGGLALSGDSPRSDQAGPLPHLRCPTCQAELHVDGGVRLFTDAQELGECSGDIGEWPAPGILPPERWEAGTCSTSDICGSR